MGDFLVPVPFSNHTLSLARVWQLRRHSSHRMLKNAFNECPSIVHTTLNQDAVKAMLEFRARLPDPKHEDSDLPRCQRIRSGLTWLRKLPRKAVGLRSAFKSMGRLAQLVRASALQAEGHPFEPDTAHHMTSAE